MRARVFLTIMLIVLITPDVASAKGPVEATIQGAGLAPIRLTGQGGDPSDLYTLIEEAGFFPATYGMEPDPVMAGPPDPMLAAPPTRDLGPKLSITWRLSPEGSPADLVRQDLFPYADSGPLTYTLPGQTFYGADQTRGGWFRAPASLTPLLTRLGVPDRASLEAAAAPVPTPTSPTSPTSPADAAGTAQPEDDPAGNGTSWWLALGLIGAVALGIGMLRIVQAGANRRSFAAQP